MSRSMEDVRIIVYLKIVGDFLFSKSREGGRGDSSLVGLFPFSFFGVDNSSAVNLFDVLSGDPIKPDRTARGVTSE